MRQPGGDTIHVDGIVYAERHAAAYVANEFVRGERSVRKGRVVEEVCEWDEGGVMVYIDDKGAGGEDRVGICKVGE